MKEKYRHTTHCDNWIAEKPNGNVTDYGREFHPKEVAKWNNNLSHWRKDKARNAINEQVGKDTYGDCARLQSSNRKGSLFAAMEHKLEKATWNHQSKGRKVSQRWMRIKGKKIQAELDKQNKTRLAYQFKASVGWFQKFLKCKKLKQISAKEVAR